MARTVWTLAALSVLGFTGCMRHEIDIKPIKVEPIHMSLDINIRIQKDLVDILAPKPSARPAPGTSALNAKIRAVAARIRALAPKHTKLEDAGIVGETLDGRHEAVKAVDDPAIKKLIADYNANAEELVRLVALKHGTTLADARENYVAFEFERASPVCYYKGRSGQWLMKKEWIERGGAGLFKD